MFNHPSLTKIVLTLRITLFLTLVLSMQVYSQYVDPKIFPGLKYYMTIDEIRALGGDYANRGIGDWDMYVYHTENFGYICTVTIWNNDKKKDFGVILEFQGVCKSFIRGGQLAWSSDCKMLIKKLKQYYTQRFGKPNNNPKKLDKIFENYSWFSVSSKITLELLPTSLWIHYQPR